MGLLGRSSDRKAHIRTVPLVGAIYIYLSVVISSVAFLNLPETFIAIALICGLITFTGGLDDRYPLQPFYRLILQLMAGVTIASMGLSVYSLGNLVGLGDINLALFAIPFTAIALTSLCNAYNMVDGIDGLAGSLTLVTMCRLLYLTLDRAPDNEVALVALLCTSISIFLAFNLKVKGKSKIFMSDAGSIFLGCSVAIAMIFFSERSGHHQPSDSPVAYLDSHDGHGKYHAAPHAKRLVSPACRPHSPAPYSYA